jgi:CubicO group peptidase (beta-lactamase class C family)
MTLEGPQAISDFLRTRVAAGDVPAVAAAVVDRDGLPYIDACGKRDVAAGADATPDTIFRLASMTKPATSLAALMLCEEGRIGLDDPIERHLPEYRQPRVLAGWNAQDGTYAVRPASRSITVRDLLAHTSGIASWFFHPLLARLHRDGKPDNDLPLLHEPGAAWTYGPSTALLGRVVARVSGETLDTFCRTRIFDPLGMVDTAYSVPAGARHRVATCHQRDAAGRLTERPNPPLIESKGRGDDGLFSTAHDYAAFVRLFLNGGRHGRTSLVKEETIASMTSSQIGDLVLDLPVAVDPSLARRFAAGGERDTFSFGFQIAREPCQPGMRRPGSLSWAGIFNTHFWIDPRQGIGGILLMQLLPGNDGKALDLLRGFERLVYRAAAGCARRSSRR